MKLKSFKDNLYLKGHNKEIRCFTTLIYNDFLAIVSGSADGTIKIWNPNLSEDKLICTLKNESTVWCLLSYKNNDNNLLASSHFDEIRIWNPSQTNTPIYTLVGHQLNVVCLSSITINDMFTIISGSYDQTIKLWNPNAKAERKTAWTKKQNSLITTLTGHEHYVCAITTIKITGENYIVSGSADKTIKIWNTKDYSIYMNLKGHYHGVYSLTTIKYKGEEIIVSGSYDKVIKLWNPNSIEDNKVIMELLDHQDSIWYLSSFEVNNETLILSSSEDRTINIWNPNLSEKSKLVESIRNESNVWCAIPYNYSDDPNCVCIVAGSFEEVKIYK